MRRKKNHPHGNARDSFILLNIVTGALVFLGILITCLIHVRHIRNNLKDVLMKQYESQMQVAEKALSDRMQGLKYDVERSTVEVEEKLERMYSDVQISQALAKYATSDDMSAIIYISNEGTAVWSNGNVNDVGSRLKDFSVITGSRFFIVDDFYNNNTIMTMLYVMPVMVLEEQTGIVVGVQPCDSLLDSEAFSNLKEIGDVYVLNRSAEILTTNYPRESFPGDSSYFMDFAKQVYHLNNQDMLLMQTCFLGVDETGDTITCQDETGKNYYFAFVPVDDYEDVVISVVYTDAVFQDVEAGIVSSTIVTAAIIVAAMVLLLLFVMWHSLRTRKMIAKYAFEDEITGGKNLNYFKSEAADILKKYKGMSYSIHRFDISNFRYINEAYGHEKADALLKVIAEEAKSIFKAKELCVRITADQHVLLVKNTMDLDERLFLFSDKVNARALDIGIRYPIKFKRGVYQIEDNTEDISILMDKANAARKELTGEEKECVAVYSDEMVKDMRKVDLIESTMESALFNGEFKMFIQPKWDIVNDHLYGGEALVRWIRDDGTMVYPSDFVPVFEKDGFVEQLDMFMLESACQLIRRLIDAGRPIYPISVNQSRVLIHNPQYIEKVTEVLRRYDIPKGSIELEITETVLFMEQSKMHGIINDLKGNGIPVSMDDFGSGYSSLNMLKDFPFDVLKIDKEFFSEVTASEASVLILTKIVEMAEGLGIRVICEGVETEEQIEMLRKIGVRYVQGYYYGKPMPHERFLIQYCHLDIFANESLYTNMVPDTGEKKNKKKKKDGADEGKLSTEAGTASGRSENKG